MLHRRLPTGQVRCAVILLDDFALESSCMLTRDTPTNNEENAQADDPPSCNCFALILSSTLQIAPSPALARSH